MALYLGIDSSTQSVKAEIIDTGTGTFVAGESVHFGTDLPEYRSPKGFLPNDDPLIRQSAPMMWLDGLELLFLKLKNSGVDLSRIKGISGSGQQHGSVYLNAGFESGLPMLDPAKRLSEQLAGTLARKVSPIWMDRSTEQECRELDERFGKRLQLDTGSPAIERFTGPQIRKFAKASPESYRNTAVIHLVSSFLCSVLCGKSAPIDYGDGAGMNLLNLKTLRWDPETAEFTAPGLLKKLPPAVPSDTIAGGLSPYFEKFGFKAGIPVAVWSGDNPNSLVGTGVSEPGLAGISLGTSDTFFAPMHTFKTDPEGCGHVMGNPAGGFMSLICFTNGSLARERIKEECGVDWNFLDRRACELTPPGNDGRLMLPYFEAESTPTVLEPGARYNFRQNEATAAQLIRAILESQALSMRLHSEWQGENFHRIRLTGGASKSIGFRQILADVFQARIELISVSNSAGLGAAMRAANAVERIPFSVLADQFCKAVETVPPNPERKTLYDSLLKEFAEFEKS